jgi:DNA-binding winged helix-turn-helix (wHTH) protein/TolB-like protein/Tfp pilus assembly protein PilF
MNGLSGQISLFGEFTLDLTRARLLRGGQEVKLRPKSFDVLKYLVANNQRLVTKGEIIQAVWPDSFVTDDSVVQCLRDVRRAMADDNQQYIKTVPRRGYIFDAPISDPDCQTAVYTEQLDSLRVVIDGEEDGAGAAGDKPVRVKSESRVRRFAHHASLSGRSKLNRAVSATLAFVLGGALVFSYIRASNGIFKSPQQPPAEHAVRSIAVLPFKPLNRESGDEYLGLGMADALITKLSSTGKLIVRPTSAIQSYTLPGQDPLAAGREQKVDAVLEGSIQRSGSKVRVTARLLDPYDGSPLWAYQCNEYCTDVFVAQDTISENLARGLALKLDGEDRHRLAKHYTDNVEAYQLYMTGVFFRNQMTETGLKKSIECFQKAIDLDPTYALAYAGIASSYSPLAWFGYMPISEIRQKGLAAITKALELDDSLSEAHSAFAEFKFFLEWDWDGAEREFKRAIELNPNEPLARLLYPDLLLIKGRGEEALAESRLGVDIDPLSPRANKGLAEVYYLAGRYDEAIEQYSRTREMFPNYSLINAGPSYERKGMNDQAVREYLASEIRRGRPAQDVRLLRQAYAKSGWRGYWRKQLNLSLGEAKGKKPHSSFLAEIYARLGETDHALEFLEKAYAEHDMSLVFLGINPVWESLKSSPRFHHLLRRINLATDPELVAAN